MPVVFELDLGQTQQVKVVGPSGPVERSVQLLAVREFYWPNHHIPDLPQKRVFRSPEVDVVVSGTRATLHARPFEMPQTVNGLRRYVETTHAWATEPQLEPLSDVRGAVRFSCVAEGAAWGPTDLRFPVRNYRWRANTYGNTWSALVPYNKHYLKPGLYTAALRSRGPGDEPVEVRMRVVIEPSESSDSPAGTPKPNIPDAFSSSAREEGFQPLLSDEALKHWRQCGPGRFAVTHGIATGEGGMGLWWYAARQFTNFVLRGEFVQEQDIADSGVFLRFPDPGSDPWVTVHKGHEMEIGDPNPADPTWRTGSIYPFQASRKANTRPLGQWNRYEITCVGHTYTVRINDEVVTTWTDPQQRSTHGYVGLQNYNDGKTVRHRNLRIKDLP